MGSTILPKMQRVGHSLHATELVLWPINRSLLIQSHHSVSSSLFLPPPQIFLAPSFLPCSLPSPNKEYRYRKLPNIPSTSSSRLPCCNSLASALCHLHIDAVHIISATGQCV